MSAGTVDQRGDPPPPLGPKPADSDDVETIDRIDHALAHEIAAQGHSPETPEARAERDKRMRMIMRHGYRKIAPGSRFFTVTKRVIVGTYFDGFIHAGNLAYMALIALFPFFILATALLSTFGQTTGGVDAINAVFSTMPPSVAKTLAGPVKEVLAARTGVLLWLGALVALWTVGSLIETIRDILRRAYGTKFSKTFWHYRLYSIGIMVAAVFLLMLSFAAQVLLAGIDQFFSLVLPDQVDAYFQILLSRGVSALGLFVALYLLFYSLTPKKYRVRGCPKWPGALATTIWWVAVTLALPPLLRGLLAYDLTYGSLAGVMVALFFFYLVGLGVVIGAELNAALAESPEKREEREERDNKADDMNRKTGETE